MIFFRFGFLGFGGPIAVVGLLEEELVKKKKWLSSEKFSQLFSVCKLLPGPISTQMAIAVAEERAGKLGGLCAGFFFILPSFMIVLLLSIFYAHTPVVTRYAELFTGLQVGALIVIGLSIIQFVKPYRRSLRAWLIFTVSAVLVFYFPRYEPLVILFFGALGAVFFTPVSRGPSEDRSPRAKKKTQFHSVFWLGIPATVYSAKLFDLFWMCFKAGAFVFGTGLAIVPVLEAEAVNRFHFLTHLQFMDGLAIGQITPGPVVITATFIGYQAAGLSGALVATLGMFLPAFINVLVLVPLIFGRFEKSPRSKSFSAFAMPAVIGAIFGASVHLGMLTLRSNFLLAVFLLGVLFAGLRKTPPWILIPAVGVITLVLKTYFVK